MGPSVIGLFEPHPEPIVELLKREGGRDPELLDERGIREPYPTLSFALWGLNGATVRCLTPSVAHAT